MSSHITTQYAAARACRRFGIYCVTLALMIGVVSAARAADYFNGREVYTQHCAICHGADGNSAVPGTPNFARGEGLYQTDAEAFRQIRDGKKAMPAFRGILDDSAIRDVIVYVRTLQ